MRIYICTALALFSGSCFADQAEIHCTDNVLQQIYPNQNACVLQASIPEKLKNLPYAIYPVQPSKYNTERFNFNKRYNVFPKAILIPTSESELVNVLKILNEEHLSFSIRSGGHGFEPASLSSDYIVDLRHFNKIELQRETVYIGAGARLGPIIEALGKENRAISTGTCQSVGIGGLTLGGGLGFLLRTYGATCDALQSITFLNANHEIIKVDANNYADLFWALRGAGNGSYGIALGFTFKTVLVPTTTYFNLRWDWNPDIVPQLFAAWEKWIADLPDTINPTLEFAYADGKVEIILEGLKVGSEPFREWEKAFKEFNPHVTMHQGSYVDSAKFWADSPTIPFQKIKSVLAFKPIPSEVLQKAIAYMNQLQQDQAKFHLSLKFIALGGKLTQGDSAFFPREATAWWHQVAKWDEQEQEPAALDSFAKFYASVAPLVSKYSYSNDVDYDLGGHYLEAYYGDHVDRLIQIKNKYDPKNIFHWKQSIPLSR